MSLRAESILGRYNFIMLRPGENDSTFTMDGGGVFVIACEGAAANAGEVRLSLLSRPYVLRTW
jgi:hypothetical protein